MYLTPNMQRRSSGSPTIASAANLPAESVSMFVGLNQLKLLALGQVQELNATRPYELLAVHSVPERTGPERHPVVYGQGIVAQFSSEWIRPLTVR